MKSKISFFTSETILLFVIAKVMDAAEPRNPCPSEQEVIVADMCTDDYVVEDSIYGSKAVDSVLLRITKQNNCICHVSLQKIATNYTIYISKYEEQSNAAPEQQNCGLAVDIEYVDTSDGTRSLQPIECNSGTSMRSIALGGSKLIFKSRIINGDFTRGYCMQVFRNQALFACNMIDQVGKVGSDDDWIVTNGTQHTSLDACKSYCLQTEDCVAVHYEQNYCFVFNRTPTVYDKDNTTFSQKHCVDTQKLKIRCYPPESTTQTNQVITAEDTVTTKLETVTRAISYNHVTNSNTKSTIEREKEISKGIHENWTNFQKFEHS